MQEKKELLRIRIRHCGHDMIKGWEWNFKHRLGVIKKARIADEVKAAVVYFVVQFPACSLS